MQNDLGMSGSTASLLTTLPVLCMGIFAPAATVLRDRIGLERTIFIALLLITGATALRATAGSVLILVVTALIGGGGLSLAGPLLSAFIKKYYPTKPGIVSIYSASMTVGAAVASAYSIRIYSRTDQIPVSLAIPALVSKFGKRRFFLIFCSVLELIGIVLLLFKLPMLPAVIALGIGAGGLFPLALMLPIVETNSSEEAGEWSALSHFGGYIIGSLGPFLIGVIYDHSGSFAAALLAMLVIIVVMIGTQWFITGRKPEVQTRS